MNCHFKKKWNPAFAIILKKKNVCNLAKFCHALYEINYLLGVVINRTFGSAKLNICTLLLFEGICGHWNGNFTLRGHLPTN